MTELEWLECKLVEPMLELLRLKRGLIYSGNVGQHPRGRRRIRLFGVAQARRVSRLVTNPHLLELLTVAESFADGVGKIAELRQLKQLAAIAGIEFVSDDLEWVREKLQHDAGWQARLAEHAFYVLAERHAFSSCCLYNNAAVALEGENYRIENAHQSNLLRDIFGNPFQPVSFSPEWRTSDVVSIAQTMYDSRDFTPISILADALQDAGCEQEDILAHCRDANGTHVRGCWVVDLVLGKS